jgi:hypothetical protein
LAKIAETEIDNTATLTLKHLMITNDVLDFMSEAGLANIENNYGDFIETLKIKGLKADVTWQEVTRSLLFRQEAKKIV